MNTFENWCDSQNLPATADRRAAWNAALEEAAKLAYAEAMAFRGTSIRSQPGAVLELAAHKIRSMQTTAGAAGGEAK